MSLLPPGFALLALTPLMPLILWQGKRVQQNTVRLPEAMGSLPFPANPSNGFSILHIGESTVAGVGVNHITEGLTANIIKALQQDGLHASACIQGKNGATVADINSLTPGIQAPDILIVTLGVNDTVRFTSEKDWLSKLQLCVNKFAASHTKVCFTQVPDMSRFPVLPAPLSHFLGLRSQLLHNALKTLCEHRNWHLFEVDLPIAAPWMAKDGYHPNAKGYKLWGQEIARQLQHLP